MPLTHWYKTTEEHQEIINKAALESGIDALIKGSFSIRAQYTPASRDRPKPILNLQPEEGNTLLLNNALRDGKLTVTAASQFYISFEYGHLEIVVHYR